MNNSSIVNWNSSGPINLTPKEFAFANTFVCVSLKKLTTFLFSLQRVANGVGKKRILTVKCNLRGIFSFCVCCGSQKNYVISVCGLYFGTVGCSSGKGRTSVKSKTSKNTLFNHHVKFESATRKKSVYNS